MGIFYEVEMMKAEQINISDEIEIRDQSGDPFTAVWNWMLERSDLTGTEKLVWIALKSYAGCPEIRPGVQTVARRAGVSIRTAQRCFEVLKKKALIRIEGRTRPDGGNATNRYILLPSPRKSGTVAAAVTSSPRCHGDTPPGVNMAPPQVSQCHPKENIKLIIKKTSTTPVAPQKPQKAPAVDPTPKGPDRPSSPSRPAQAAAAVFNVDDVKKLINGTAFHKISEQALQMFIKKFGSKCVFDSLDMLIVNYKRNDRPVKDPVAVLTIALLKGIFPPTDYVPYHERMENERKAKEAAELRRTAEINRRKDEEDAHRRMVERFESLPEQDREMLLNQARSTVAPVLRNFKHAVRSKAIELCSRGP
jgi:hypothetical protein